MIIDQNICSAQLQQVHIYFGAETKEQVHIYFTQTTESEYLVNNHKQSEHLMDGLLHYLNKCECKII